MSTHGSSTQSQTPYIDAVLSCLPPSVLNPDITSLLTDTDSNNRRALDGVLRFSLGGACPDASAEPQAREAWSESQTRLSKLLAELGVCAQHVLGKRPRTENGTPEAEDQEQSSDIKKKKLNAVSEDSESASAQQLYTLHSISTSSPVRKKVDITITSSSIRFTHPTTHALEGFVPLSSITRAFLIATSGKNNNKPRWSVVLLPSDTNDRKGKGPPGSGPVQIVFSVDASTPSGKDQFTTTAHPAALVAHTKGSDTHPYLRAFLAHLPPRIALIEAQTRVDAYRAAKEGCLYFLREGILWAESKPCEFFAVEDIASGSEEHGSGIKTLSATGRTFSLFVQRKSREVASSDDQNEEEEAGEEAEFSLIDGKQQDHIAQWVRKHRHLFGKKTNNTQVQANGNGNGAEADSDEGSDEDFVDDAESDGGSVTSSNDDEGSEQADDNDVEEEGQESDFSDDMDEDEMAPERHPLLRPGAMPRMSKAALNAVVGMVEEDMNGYISKGPAASDEDDEEHDELDD